MTATLNGQQLPDAATVLRRAIRLSGDDLPAETITAITEAIQRQIIEPLAGRNPAEDTADREAADLRRKLADKDSELDTARAERDTANGRVRDLEEALAAARKDAETWESECQRVIDDKLVELVEAKQALAAHEHRYVWRSPDEEPVPCECGKPWPRALVEVEEDEPAPEPQAWEQLRAELIAAGFPEATA